MYLPPEQQAPYTEHCERPGSAKSGSSSDYPSGCISVELMAVTKVLRNPVSPSIYSLPRAGGGFAANGGGAVIIAFGSLES